MLIWKTDEGVLFHQDNAPTHKSVVAVAAVHDCGFQLVDYPPHSADWHHLFSVPQYNKNPWLESSIGPMMRSYLQLRTFSRIRMRASIPGGFNRCNTDGRNVWTTRETMLKNKPHVVKFDHCIRVSLSMLHIHIKSSALCCRGVLHGNIQRETELFFSVGEKKITVFTGVNTSFHLNAEHCFARKNDLFIVG